MRDLASLTAADFEGAAGTDFEIVIAGSDPVKIRLMEVVVLRERPDHRPQFSLQFRGPLAPVLAQVTHHVRHAEMGQFELFLGPVAAQADGIIYEAVFA